MRIQHNITAMNSLTSYSANSKTLAGNLKKLSSGYRINSAADDAAGLAISEKMRAQIAGLDKAQDNCNDGISLVQTAEGALTEVSSMLTRMSELATQSANGTYDDSVDRVNLQQEVENLMDEMDRISKATNFNGVTLLDGSLSGKSQVSNLGIDISKAVQGAYSAGTAFQDSISFTDLTQDDIGKSIDYTVTWTNVKGETRTTTVSLTYQGDGTGVVDTATTSNNYFTDDQGSKYYLDATNGNLSAAQVCAAMEAGLKSDEEFGENFFVSSAGDQLQFTNITPGTGQAVLVETGCTTDLSCGNPNFAGDGSAVQTKVPQDSMQKFNVTSMQTAVHGDSKEKIESMTFSICGNKFLLANSTLTELDYQNIDSDVHIIEVSGNPPTGATDAAKIASEVSRVTGMKTQVATTADTEAQIDQWDVLFTEDTLNIKDGGKGLELQIGDTPDEYQKITVEINDMSANGLGLTGLDIGTQEGAQTGIETIKNAINLVSLQRGDIGAMQNRLEHTLNSLAATDENTTASESQIRDVDMAEEMTAYSKNNVLLQAAQSMLAQANALPQGVLSLLQS